MFRPQIDERGLRALLLACRCSCRPRTGREHGTTPHPACRSANPEDESRNDERGYEEQRNE